ncbi:MAG: acetoacetate--CoA ligase [Mycobacteriales bacterium]
MAEVSWQPSDERVAAAALTSFRRQLGEAHGVDLTSYDALHAFSVERMGEFWSQVWDFCEVVGDKGDRPVVDEHDLRRARFFPAASLNFAENLLRRSDDSLAIIFRGEDGLRRDVTWKQLTDNVARAARALTAAGVGPSDRVAAWLPNITEAYVTMLATATLGAVYSSTSPDFGAGGVLDRFAQIEPTVLVAADGYRYAGRAHDCLDRLADIRAGLPSLKKVVVVPFLDETCAAPEGAVSWDEFLAPHGAGTPPYRRMPFDAPLYILFSSGTTGVPKCITHSTGGILLQHLKEHRLHCDIKPDDRVFYYTTTGWMMWNWLASALASEATLVVYDGAPMHPQPDSLFDLAQDVGVTLFGTSAKFLDAAHKAGLRPRDTHDLSSVRTITSTGSPLVAESFDYVYADIATDVHLASISGGTDICGCFVLGDPTRPVHRGEIQGPGLGMAVDVLAPDGTPESVAVPGELVCRKPFPSMPVGFWGDDDGSRYDAAYFAHFPGLWRHGDWIARTESGGYVISGRSDATLNPGGVRIGTAEIYRQVEGFAEVAESIVIGQDWDGDQRVVLFVRLADGAQLDDDLATRIRSRIRAECTPRHVPAKILAVPELPRTRSGKLVELAVRDVVHGRPLTNTEALANPDSLDYFRDRPELRA